MTGLRSRILSAAQSHSPKIFGNVKADDPEIDSVLGAAQAFQERAPAFNNLALYEQRLHRILEKSLAQLEKLQSERKYQEAVALDKALVLYHAAQKEGKSFNPLENGSDFSEAVLKGHTATRRRLEEAVRTLNRSLLPKDTSRTRLLGF